LLGGALVSRIALQTVDTRGLALHQGHCDLGERDARALP
jgi:hypothetical protein